MATIRIDDELKKDADKMFDEVGMNTSVAVKIFLTRFVKTGKFPFEIEAFDYRTKKWKEKIKPTNFFPKDWDKTKLLEEINFANQYKKLKEGTKKVFESITKSGVNVIFIVDNEKIKTVYPIIK